LLTQSHETKDGLIAAVTDGLEATAETLTSFAHPLRELTLTVTTWEDPAGTATEGTEESVKLGSAELATVP
jgi:hypothetical protein